MNPPGLRMIDPVSGQKDVLLSGDNSPVSIGGLRRKFDIEGVQEGRRSTSR